MKTPPAPVCVACAAASHDNCRGCLCTHNDPVIMAAQALALTMAHFRAMLTDPAYEDKLPAFESLMAALPVPIAMPADRSSRT